MKKPGKEKPARMVQSPPKKTTVQRLYDPPESSGRTECEETQKSEKFDLGRNDIDKHAEWYKHMFDENDLKDNLEVKVSDKDGNVLWCIDLNEILCDEVKDEVEGPVEPRVEQRINTKPVL
ncbi:Hypothetical predicted protein [Paramuricea clavata]|uniref:Uncharacterized protein n=1 Tax=Paramuricea clavata TaxID=317549 RepID=A0A6S7J7U4_PARCT|nr:Hypothetical predicted protein [Paramuricea clavata]